MVYKKKKNQIIHLWNKRQCVRRNPFARVGIALCRNMKNSKRLAVHRIDKNNFWHLISVGFAPIWKKTLWYRIHFCFGSSYPAVRAFRIYSKLRYILKYRWRAFHWCVHNENCSVFFIIVQSGFYEKVHKVIIDVKTSCDFAYARI